MAEADPNAPVTNAECTRHRECIFRNIEETAKTINKHTDETIFEHNKNAEKILAYDMTLSDSVRELVDGFKLMIQEQKRLSDETVQLKTDQGCIKEDVDNLNGARTETLKAVGSVAESVSDLSRFVKPLAESQVKMQETVTQNQTFMQTASKENQQFIQKIVVRLLEVGAVIVFALLGLKAVGIPIV